MANKTLAEKIFCNRSTKILFCPLQWNNLCNFTTWELKLKRWFCTQKPVEIGHLHKSLWKCHSHNTGVFNAEISIYSRVGFFIYFMQIPAFYVFCRKSSNIFEKNLRTRGFIRNSLYKIFEQINEKFRAGINGYFCIKKILHFNGNVRFKDFW